MKAYMVQSEKRIAPFGDHPRDCLIVNKPLAVIQKEVLTSIGIDLVTVADDSSINDEREHLVFVDQLYFSVELLSEFISKSRDMQRRTVAALKPGLTTLRTIVNTQDVSFHPDRIEYDLRYVPSGGLRSDFQPIVIKADQMEETVLFPRHLFGEREYRVPLTDKLIVQIDHWTNLLAANIVTLLAEGARLKQGSKLRLLWLALKARSINQWKVLRQMNRIGQDCDIHPTAYIEGSTIGDNVKIGAMAIVRESMVGDGTHIANHSSVELSVIGDACALWGGALVQYSVLYPETFTQAQVINASICGKDTFLGAGAVLTDFRLDRKSVMVLKDGTLKDTGNTFLGSCLGHSVYIGSGCVISPGRAVSRDLRIVPNIERRLRSFRSAEYIRGFQLIR